MTTMKLQTKFVLVIIGVSLMSSALINIARVAVTHNQQLTQLKRTLNNLETTRLPATSTSSTALDQGQATAIAHYFLSHPNVHYVQVTDNNQRTVRLGGTSSFANEMANEVSSTFNIYYLGNAQNPILGDVTLKASLPSLGQALRTEARALLLSSALYGFIMAISTLLLVRYLVTRPLAKLHHFFNRASSFTETRAVHFFSTKVASEELLTLQNAINRFRKNSIDSDVINNMRLRQFNALTQANPEIIWRCDLPAPVSVRELPQQQVEAIFTTGVLAELNDTAKSTLFQRQDIPKNNIKNLPFIQESLITSMIQANYRIKEVVTHYEDKSGVKHYFRNSLACWVERDHIFSIWGIAINVTQSFTTEQSLKQREQQLNLSQTRLSQAQALAHMGHWNYFVVDESFQLSDELARIFGLDPNRKNITWKDLASRIHPEDKGYIMRALSDTSSEAAGAEYRIVWPNGEVRFVQAIAQKTLRDNTIESTFGILFDITDRRRAEQERGKSQRALAESEARLAQAQAIAHMGHWLLDCDTHTLSCSDEFYRLLGLLPQQIQLDKNQFLDYIHRDDRALILPLFSSAAGQSLTQDFRVTVVNGSQRYMRGTFTPFYAGGKTNERIFGVMMDITEQKHAEYQLKASQELFATAFDSSPDAIFFVESDNNTFIKVNHAFAAMLNTTESKLLRQQFTQAPVLVQKHGNGHISEYIALEKSATNIEVQIPGEGSVVRGLLSWQHVRISQKNCILGIIHDVTPLRALEKTTTEQQKQLIQADKLASIGTMVAGVAHEINNPNHLIQMNADLLEGFYKSMLALFVKSNKEVTNINNLSMDEVIEVIPELLTDLKSSSGRINRIVNDLKDFSRPQENSEYRPTDLNNILEKTLNLLSSLVEKHPANFKVEIAKDLPLIRADSQRIEQVLVNLIMNALEASNDLAIAVRTRFNRDTNLIECDIEDQGCGIPAEHLTRIFDPFYTTKQAKGGTGLGLAISYRLIQEHGGTIAALPNPSNQGVTLRLTLPPMSKVN